jgi:hypothetical protein
MSFDCQKAFGKKDTFKGILIASMDIVLRYINYMLDDASNEHGRNENIYNCDLRTNDTLSLQENRKMKKKKKKKKKN